MSPVFHQFLDATYQLVRQYPKRFEFNERFLRRLFYHLYSCQYGTFLLNNEKQRKDAKLDDKTTSVWDYFLSRPETFINPDYDFMVNDHVRGQERLIFPRLDQIRWWYQLFGRTDEEMNSGLDEDATRKDKVAETVESLTGSPHPGDSPPCSGAGTPMADQQQSRSTTLTFGDTVLAGVEVPLEMRKADKSSGSTVSVASKQEMSSMGGTGNVAP